MNNERTYYSCPILWNGEVLYLLWFSADVEGVVTDQHTVLAWVPKAALHRYADTHGIVVCDEQPAPYDFDQVSAFANAEVEIGAREALDAWNLFVDIATSIGVDDFLSAEREQLDLYNHLFYLTGAAPVKDTHPDPLSSNERDTARRILALGLEILKKHIRVQRMTDTESA